MMQDLKNQSSGDREQTIFFRREGGVYRGLCYYAVRRGDFKLVQAHRMKNFNYSILPWIRLKNTYFPLKQKSSRSKKISWLSISGGPGLSPYKRN